ncbi:MAG: hemerythrin domain-containing protein [Gammaproteobacteria bacterium]|nr:hemerythrin domain-containing protein [Gammaproteobacteria bacterium]MBU1647259.1 hemerythrin domain-containing protein [Gammaproteobacteria bacterium]MBU1972771.1 hemerythrin domain-containing protein [Gammaproteobacteria bacterium]
MPIQWSKKFETGNPDIDREHRHLFDLVNLLDTALEKPEPHILSMVFLQLAGYICHHLVSEESLAARYQVDAALQERLHREHQTFVAEIGRLQHLMEASPVKAARDLHACLIDFINNHVLTTDFALAAALPGNRPPDDYEADEAERRSFALRLVGS